MCPPWAGWWLDHEVCVTGEAVVPRWSVVPRWCVVPRGSIVLQDSSVRGRGAWRVEMLLLRVRLVPAAMSCALAAAENELGALGMLTRLRARRAWGGLARVLSTSPARVTEDVRIPRDTRDWGGVERTESVVEQRYAEIQSQRAEQRRAEAEVQDGVLIYENQNRMRPLRGSLSFTVPWAAAAYVAYAKSVGDLPLDTAPWLLVGALALTGALARSISRSASELTAHRIWLTNGGRDLRVQTFRHWFWGAGPLVRYPASSVIEHVPEGSSDSSLRSQVRLLHIKGDKGPYLVMYRNAGIPHPDVYEMVLRGEAGLTEDEAAAAEFSQASEERASRLREEGEWQEAVDEKGRKYFWHTATRETRWTRPRD